MSGYSHPQWSNSLPQGNRAVLAATGGEPGSSGTNGGRVAIPRLGDGRGAAYPAPERYHRRHVSRACESCRQRKTKCTGEPSGCRNCLDAHLVCCYTDGKREKSKKQLATLETRIQDLEGILKTLGRCYNMPVDDLIALCRSQDISRIRSSLQQDSPTDGDLGAVRTSSNKRIATTPVNSTEDLQRGALTHGGSSVVGVSGNKRIKHTAYPQDGDDDEDEKHVKKESPADPQPDNHSGHSYAFGAESSPLTQLDGVLGDQNPHFHEYEPTLSYSNPEQADPAYFPGGVGSSNDIIDFGYMEDESSILLRTSEATWFCGHASATGN